LGTTPARDIGLFAILTAFYVVTMPSNRTEADDAFAYAYRVEIDDIENPFELSHLAFIPFMRAAFRFAQLLGYSGRAYPLLVGIGIVSSVVTVILAVRFLNNRLGLTLSRSLAGGALVALSYGFWRYAAEVEVYSLATTIAMALVYVVTSERRSGARTAIVIVLGALLVLTHAMFGLITYVVIPLVYYRSRLFKVLMGYLLAVSILLVLATYGIFRLVSGGWSDLSGYVAFLLDFPGGSTAYGLSWLVLNGAYLFQSLVGFNFLLAFPVFRDLIERMFDRFSLAEEFYLGLNTPRAISIGGSITGVILAVAVVGFVIKAFRHRAPRVRSPEAATVLLWLATTFVVQMWAGGAETWQLATVPLWLSVVWLTRQMPVIWPALVAATLGLHNLVGGLGPLYPTEADMFANKASWIVADTDSSDVVATSGPVVFFRYLRYWAPSEVVHLQFLTEEQLLDLSAEWNGVSGDVYFTGDVLDPPALRSLTPSPASNYPETYAAMVEFGHSISENFELANSDEFGGVYRFTKE